jgi:hypothetical protein
LKIRPTNSSKPPHPWHQQSNNSKQVIPKSNRPNDHYLDHPFLKASSSTHHVHQTRKFINQIIAKINTSTQQNPAFQRMYVLIMATARECETGTQPINPGKRHQQQQRSLAESKAFFFGKKKTPLPPLSQCG